MNTNVLFAVFKRNFVSYFASPTGYVFICVFVCLSALAAFYPPDFFNSNLANLDQLNLYFPLIMLFFVPAITMSVWADERRQGTDELLLTIPASDFDVVLGKYLAALAIYSVSLCFSFICNYLVLNHLANGEAGFTLAPQVDFGLFFATYVGYWLVGVAMLGIGMVASFLTGNLTVAFILGALFNVPLVALVMADTLLPTVNAAVAVKQWTIAAQFRDFGNGVLTFSGLVYFGMILVVTLYLGMVLIGRRHWFTGQRRQAMVLHYGVRAAALLAIAIGANVLLRHVPLFQRVPFRIDTTAEQVNSLSTQTRELLDALQPKSPVKIEAFISPTVPEAFVQTRMNVLAMLREFEARGRGQVQLRVNNTDLSSEEAALAEKRYNIQPRRVQVQTRGKWEDAQIFLHVAVNCGTEKVDPVFFDRGIPVEYELLRSIMTVAQSEKKRIGVVQTDAQLFGGFSMSGSSPSWPVIDELRKQYDVVQLDGAKLKDLPDLPEKRKELEKQKEELTGKLGKLKPADAQAEKLRGELKDVEDKLRDARGYDAILAVQPSSLGPEDFESFIAVVEKGIPTAIFEDPFPAFAGNVPGTSMPRQAGGGGMMGMMMPRGGQPKGDINRLWTSLGVDFSNDQVVWQDYNPYQKATQFPAEFVFLDDGAKAQFNSGDAISKGLQHMLFPFPGSITGLHASELKFTPLVKTGARTGTVKANEILEQSPFGPRDLNPSRRRQFTARDYTLAAEIRGTVKAAKPMAAGMPPGFSFDEPPQPSKPLKPPGDRTINVVLVADLDMLTREFFRLREQGNIPEMGIHFDFDNVTFVLNALDRLTGDERFIELRSRRPKHRTLKQIDKRTEDAREDAIKAREEFVKEFEDAEKRAQEAMNKELEKLQNRKDVDPRTQMIELASVTIDLRRKMEAEVEQKKQERDRKLKKSDIDLNLEINRVRSWYKAWALLLPPILPLALAIVVFVIRRVRESEGVARSRLRG